MVCIVRFFYPFEVGRKMSERAIGNGLSNAERRQGNGGVRTMLVIGRLMELEHILLYMLAATYS